MVLQARRTALRRPCRSARISLCLAAAVLIWATGAGHAQETTGQPQPAEPAPQAAPSPAPAPPTPPAPATPQSSDAPDAVPESATVLNDKEAGSILGKEVRSVTDEKLGRIVDVIVDRRGMTRAAVIDFGGFLGVGSKKIAVAWDMLTFPGSADAGADKITVQTTRDRLNKAPEYKDGKPIVVLGARAGTMPNRVTLNSGEQ